VRRLVFDIGGIRAAITDKNIPPPIDIETESEPPHSVPFLREMETTVALIVAVLAGSQSGSQFPLSTPDKSSSAFLVADAFTNPEHIQFGLKGCLAASLCYFVYNALFWPDLGTAVTTCFVTALTSVGASHQKQVMRFAGALVGGFGIGMSAQIFVLPYLDSIAGFTVLFITVIAASAWIATSSSRLSYFGVQLAVAFAFITVAEFKFQPSLAVARDRVVGVLLGLSMMWLAFDRLWAAPSAVEMKRSFIASLRLLAESAREPRSDDRQIAIGRISSLRETLNKQLGKVRSLADGVLFEFGPTRQQDLALRSRIRRWQPRLRTFSVMRNTLIKYRLQLPGFELPVAVREAQQEFDKQVGWVLDSMADRLEDKASDAKEELGRSFRRLQESALKSGPEAERTAIATHLETFLPLCRMTESLIVTLDAEVP
jgi:multidrug resistance protein MdtO